MMRMMEYTNVHDYTNLNDLWDMGWPCLEYEYDGDAGMDLRSMEECTVRPGERVTIGTGVAVAVPAGCLGFVVPRSGLARDHGITVTNSPGLIDSSYRGEIGVILQNCGGEDFRVSAGDRIAQLVAMPFVRCAVRHVDSLDETERGDGGFGSTGLR